MTNLKDLTTEQLRRIMLTKKKIEQLHSAVKKRVDKLHSKIESIVDGVMPPPLVSLKNKKRKMSRAARAAISAAAKARWAKAKAAGKKTL